MSWKMKALSVIILLVSMGSASAQITCHLGAQVGATIASTSISDGSSSADGLSARSRSPDFGAHTGCDLRMTGTPFVVGGWGEFMWRDVAFKIDMGGPGISAGFGNSWAIGGRVGYKLDGGAMPYALLGYTKTDINAPAAAGLSSTLGGWMMGGGVEIPLTKSLSFAGEARWTKYDGLSLDTLSSGVSAKTDALSVVGRLSFNLN